MSIVFKTPGLIPIEAFTTFGINSKPNTSNPIGFFGTGLKYAVAVLCRLGVPVEVWIGETCYNFYSQPADFRGKTFSFIKMKRRNGLLSKWVGHTRLPFTTELGKNWELWQAFREIQSNTLDELGTSYHHVDEDGPVVGKAGYTHVVIPGLEFEAVWRTRTDVFLEGGVQLAADGSDAQVLAGPCPYIYYRGLRVLSLQKEALFTWNILSAMQLTEDRTLAAQYMPAYYAVRQVVRSKDKDFIRKVLEADENWFEHSFDFSNISVAPTQEFIECARIYGRRSHVGGYLNIFDPQSRPARASIDWRLELIGVLEPPEWESIDWNDVRRIVDRNKTQLKEILQADYDSSSVHPKPLEIPAMPLRGVVDVAGTVTGRLNVPGPEIQELPLEVPGTGQDVEGYTEIDASATVDYSALEERALLHMIPVDVVITGVEDAAARVAADALEQREARIAAKDKDDEIPF